MKLLMSSSSLVVTSIVSIGLSVLLMFEAVLPGLPFALVRLDCLLPLRLPLALGRGGGLECNAGCAELVLELRRPIREMARLELADTEREFARDGGCTVWGGGRWGKRIDTPRNKLCFESRGHRFHNSQVSPFHR